MVKTKLLMLTAVAGMLVACSADETVENNPGLEISFAPSINKVTRAADVTSDNLKTYGFNVTAMKQVAGGSETPYFSGVDYTWSSTANVYGSIDKYYWPATDKLNFYAYAMATDAASQVSKIDYKSFTVTPDADWKKQVDLVFASTKDKVKADGENGVVLNFRHTGAKIKVKVKNTSKTLRFDVTGWKVGFLSPTATFTFDGTATDNHTPATGTHTLSMASWANHAGRSSATVYVSAFNQLQIPAATTTDDHEQNLDGEMILLPQETPELTAYASATAGADVTNPYIALKMVIRNNDANGTVVASEDGGGAIWATWPLPTAKWEPGKVYTYLVDLSGGGYYPGNKPGTDPKLDPLLNEIKFISVTVDDWVEDGPHNVVN